MENLSICQQKDVCKKKRKNKKKKRTGPKQKMSSEDHDNDENEDEITRTVRMVDKMFGTSTHHHHQVQSLNSATQQEIDEQSKNNVLYVQYKNLNPQVEMKRMFGKIVNQEQQKKRRAGGGTFRSLKSVYMSNPKESWPPINRTGLFMNIVPAPDISPTKNEKNVIYFSFEHCKYMICFISSVKINLNLIYSTKLSDHSAQIFGKR
jgi:hypothetical protein